MCFSSCHVPTVNEPFSLREDVSQDAWLKCPNCGNQFRLGDALDAFYAPWHIVPAPGTDTTSESSSRFTPVTTTICR